MAKIKNEQKQLVHGSETKFEWRFVDDVKKLCSHWPATDAALASYFDVHRNTIAEWKKEFPQFDEAIKYGRKLRDRRVERALLSRALGCRIKEQKIHPKTGEIVELERDIPPDERSISKWLNNSPDKRWKDTTDLNVKGDMTVTPVINVGIAEPLELDEDIRIGTVGSENRNKGTGEEDE